MKIEYRVLMGTGVDPEPQVVDTIMWNDLDKPTYETGRVRPMVESLVEIYGAERARAILADGWSNGYTSTRAV